jgi:hypothetical protein
MEKICEQQRVKDNRIMGKGNLYRRGLGKRAFSWGKSLNTMTPIYKKS